MKKSIWVKKNGETNDCTVVLGKVGVKCFIIFLFIFVLNLITHIVCTETVWIKGVDYTYQISPTSHIFEDNLWLSVSTVSNAKRIQSSS